MRQTTTTRFSRKSIIRLSCFLFFASVVLPHIAVAESGFTEWIDNFYSTAAQEGINRNTYTKTFQNVTTIDPIVLEKANYQPEFTTEIWDYLDARVTPQSIAMGKDMAIQYRSTLDTIERDLGVDRSIILAIWSMESNYGAVLKKTNRLHYVPRALATLAYKDKKRARFAQNQLIAILKMVQGNMVKPAQLMGSWAGAMGHTQFIPTSYQAYSVSLDGIPGSDIWNSVPDALGTAASLLKHNGWQKGKTWGYEVVVPTNGAQYSGKTMTLAQWQNLGFKSPKGIDLSRSGDNAVLKMIGGDTGPGFLMTHNFFVIKKYNNSDFYALAVGLVADGIAKDSRMQQGWPRPAGALDIAEKYELQLLLKALGYYAGDIDGSLGSGSREAIEKFQRANQMSPTGLANQDLLKVLRTK